MSSKGSQDSSKNKNRGEIAELKDYLASTKIDQKKDAIRKIIDAMTRGKDVSMLFPDIIKNMETNNLELKKLLYLYIINYAKTQPDLALLGINSFRKDAVDKTNPFLRALAVRTMGCIRVSAITEYLFDPLKAAIKDEDSYVRKTAAICIAKLYDVSPQLIEQQGFLKLLENLSNDGNAMVVSNSICGLQQISESKGQQMLNLTPLSVQKLLTAMNECNEWSVIYLIDALSSYQPADDKETDGILDRIAAKLSHSNPGVVLSTIRVIMKYMDFLTSAEQIRGYCKKLTAPLVTLLQCEPEIQFITLKNINLIIQKKPIVMENQLKVFFCNFNDQIYIKLMKLEVLIKLANIDNHLQILHELKEYTTEIDVEFVRKSVRAIGRIAIKLEKAAEKCVNVLWECLKGKINYVVQETIIVIRDIFRKYPRRYENILRDLCENLKSLDDPEAKAAMIWIIGEYVDTIENADQLLSDFASNFKDEPQVVQQQIIISSIKLFLQRPKDGYELTQNVLKVATTECENPDLRDRGFIYFRLLQTDPNLAKKIVYSERPAISDQSYSMETEILDKLIESIGTLASVYYKPPESFVKKLRDVLNQKDKEENEQINEVEGEFLTNVQVNAKQMYGDVEIKNVEEDNMPQPQTNQMQTSSSQQQSNKDVDLLGDDLLGMPQQVTQAPTKQPDSVQQTLQQTPQQTLQPNPSANKACRNIKIPYCEVLSEQTPSMSQNAKGLQIEAAFQRENPKILLYLKIVNKSNKTYSEFSMKFKQNSFKLQPAEMNINNVRFGVLKPGQSAETCIEINNLGQSDNQPPETPFKIQCGLKCDEEIFVFSVPCSLSVLLVEGSQLNQEQYQECSKKLEKKTDELTTYMETENLKSKFKDNNIFYVGSRISQSGIEMLSFSAKCINEMPLMLDVIPDKQNKVFNIQFGTVHPSMLPLYFQAINFILKF